MKPISVAALLLVLLVLLVTTTSAARKKVRKQKCYKAYNKAKNSCNRSFKGRYTVKDCCSSKGGVAYGYKRRGKKSCTPCKKGATPENWASWSHWSDCSAKNCGLGRKRRTRKCKDINDIGCPGKQTQTKKCTHPTKPNCPVHGGWSKWGNWTACSASCGKGQQLRFRTCTNPKPQYGGNKCVGTREDKQKCKGLRHCPINGEWNNWGPWSACSVTCDIGKRQRRRKCDNPAPKYGGRKCDPKDAIAKQSCDTFKSCDESSGCSGSGSGEGSGSGCRAGSGSGSGSGEGEDSEGGDDSGGSGTNDNGSASGSGSGGGSGDGSGLANKPKKKTKEKSKKPTTNGDFHFSTTKAPAT